MSFVVQKDELFRLLYEVSEGKTSAPNSKISSALGSFRKSLSLAWLESIKNHDPLGCLTTVILTILKFTEHQDASVRVTSYSILGALLLCVAPFDPNLFIRAFGVATGKTHASSRSSIAVINMFIHLSRFVSPVRLQEFIILVPVAHHFKADVTDFLKFLPQIIPEMKDLPISFHQSLLRTLIFSCSRKLNSNFTGAVSALITLNKPKHVPYFKQLLINKNDPAAIVCLGPILIGDQEIFNLLEEDGRELFLSTALTEISKQSPGFTEFESACLTCSHFLRYSAGQTNYQDIHKRIFSQLRNDYPPHFSRLRMLLPLHFEDIFASDEKTDSMEAARLLALASFLNDHPEETDADEVASIFLKFKSSKNDLYCSLIEAYERCVPIFFQKCKKLYHIELLLFILKKKNINWVHDMAVANLLASIDPEYISQYLPNFFGLSVDRLLFFSLSQNNRLFSAAVSAIEQIVSYETLDTFLYKILQSDFLDEFIVVRRFELLSNLASVFKSDVFQYFVDIAFECLLLFDTVNVVARVCSFLSKIKVRYISNSVRTYCFNFLIANFESFTQKILEIPETENTIPVPSTSFLDTVDTDVVTNPSFEMNHALSPLRNCFNFLCSLSDDILRDLKSFFWICINLVPLFEKKAIEKAAAIEEKLKICPDIFWDVIFTTFSSTSKDSVAAECCRLFAITSRPLPPKIEVMVEKYLIEQRSNDPDLLYYCFVLVDQKQHDKAIQAAPTMITTISQQKASVLLFKLTLVIGRELLSTITEEYYIALLQFANAYGDTYAEKVSKYLDNTPFHYWPIEDHEMNNELITFLKNRNVKVPVEDKEKMDALHWEFVANNKGLFDRTGIADFILDNPKLFAKIDIKSLISRSVVEYVFQLEEVDECHLATATPIIKSGHIFNSLAHLKSYLIFAESPLLQSQLDQILTLCQNNPEILSLIFQHSTKYNLEIPNNFILINQYIRNDIVFPHFVKYLHIKYKSIAEIPISLKRLIETKVEQKLEPCLPLLKNKDIVNLDPAFFLTFFTEQQVFNSCQYRHLMSLIQEGVEFDPVALHELIAIHLSVYSGLNTNKKRALLLRFIAVVINSLFERNLIVEADLIIALLSASFEMIFEETFPTIEYEMSFLLPIVLRTETVQNKQFIQYIDKMMQETHYYSLFLNVTSRLLCEKQICLTFINLETFKKQFESEIPSQIVQGLKGLRHFAAPSCKFTSIGIIHECAEVLTSRMARLAYYQATTVELVEVMKSLFATKNMFKLSDQFYQTFAMTYLLCPKLPCYNFALSVLHNYVLLYPSSVDVIFEQNFVNQNVADAFRNLIETCTSLTGLNDRVCSFFVENPHTSLVNLIIETAEKSQSIESTFYFMFNKLTQVSNYSITFHHLLFMFSKKFPSIKEIIKTVAPYMEIESDQFAINFLCAAANNNNTDKILSEFNSCM